MRAYAREEKGILNHLKNMPPNSRAISSGITHDSCRNCA